MPRPSMLYEISGALPSNGDIKLMAQKSQNYSIYYLLYGLKKNAKTFDAIWNFRSTAF